MSVKVHEALRVCRNCGLEARTEESLELFRKSKRLPHGRETICKSCYNKNYVKVTYPNLRKCRFCGFEAHFPEELELFRKRNAGRHGRDSWCRECFNKEHRKGGKYHAGLEMRRVRELSRYHISLENKVCEECGSSGKLHRHHNDYSNPLDVVILCIRCHAGVHK